MQPYLFEVLDMQITSYGAFVVIGVLSAWLLVWILSKRDRKDVGLTFLMSIAGAVAGAFLLRPITRIPQIITHFSHIRQLPLDSVLSLLFGEIVFYGGLIGGTVAMVLFCKGFRIEILPKADLFAPAIALGHGFGRIGCFLGGCCYGIVVDFSHPLAIIFPPETPVAPAGVPLLPVQLIEAFSLFILSAALAVTYKKAKLQGVTIATYGIIYSSLRFVLEFFRGDMVRGIYGPLSISAYISMAIFAISAGLLCYVTFCNLKNKAKTSKISTL